MAMVKPSQFVVGQHYYSYGSGLRFEKREDGKIYAYSNYRRQWEEANPHPGHLFLEVLHRTL